MPRRLLRSFVRQVDMVSGLAYGARQPSPTVAEFLDLRRVVANLAVLDFSGPDHCIPDFGHFLELILVATQ